MGGLAIYLGFVLSLILFVELTKEVRGILLGSVVIVAMGILDDKYNLRPLIKLAIQILAAGIAILHGVVWDYISSGGGTVSTGLLAYPLTIFWIVACTNAVNLIDGLDGLAAGISSISSLTMLLVAYFLLEPEVAVILAAVFGACIGFLPYNMNPAKIFMGDTGSQFLGYILATASMLGLFKFYAIFTIFVPLVSLVYPLMDTGFAFLRRISHGASGRGIQSETGCGHSVLRLGLSLSHAHNQSQSLHVAQDSLPRGDVCDSVYNYNDLHKPERRREIA